MAKQQKFYVVWKGVEPGIYSSWTDCQLQIKNYKGAIYKSFSTREEAEHAFATPAHHYLKASRSQASEPEEKKIPENFDLNCLAVDAACSGNPGPMEYRGVYLLTGHGSLQAMEAIKYIIGKGDLLTGRLLTYDALKMEFHTIKLPKDHHCAICGDNPTIHELIDYEQAECDMHK